MHSRSSHFIVSGNRASNLLQRPTRNFNYSNTKTAICGAQLRTQDLSFNIRSWSTVRFLSVMARKKGQSMVGGYKGGRTLSQNESNGNKTDAARPKKPPLTHFLCFPLVTVASKPQLESSLQQFTQLVSKPDSKEKSREAMSLPTKAIRPLGTLHLTLGVMSLMGEDKLQGAMDLLRSLDVAELLNQVEYRGPAESLEPSGQVRGSATASASATESSTLEEVKGTLKSVARSITPPLPSRSTKSSQKDAIIATDPIVISLKSLHPMQSPTKTSILYAAPEPQDKLLSLGRKLQTIFKDAEYMVPDDRPLKLHATIVNTIYAKQSGRGCHSKAPLRFDATALIEHLEDYVWAENVRVEKIAICKMGATEVIGDDGKVVGQEYEELVSIPLP
jgi:activating signal cointegrator complex subunit 1